MIEQHPFQPFIPSNATIAILGSFPGKEDTQHNDNNEAWYYGAPRNQFWKIMSAVFDTPLSSKQDKQQLLSKHGIAIADIFRTIRRTRNSNADDNLQVLSYNTTPMEDIISNTNITTLCCTSQFVGKCVDKLFYHNKKVVVLPSPSPRYARMSLTEKTQKYREILLSIAQNT